MNFAFRLGLAALALPALSLAPAAACSVVPGYKVPTTLELAERAELIVVGTVTGKTRGGDSFIRQIEVQPTLLLKGAALPATLDIPGHIVAGDEQAPTTSDPRELRRPNPDGLTGGCTRYLFAPGMKLVLFYERRDGELRFAGHPFARVSEDVATDDALWVEAVKLYVGIAALPKGERRAAMIAHHDALRDKGDPDSVALAGDLDVEIAHGGRPPVE